MVTTVPREYVITLTGTDVGGDGANAKFGAILPFNAQQVLAVFDGSTGVVYLSLASTSGSTGSGWPIKPGESFSLGQMQTSAFAVATTTTSTSAEVRFGAWQW